MQNFFQTSHPQMLSIDITLHTTCVFIYIVNCIQMAFRKAATCYRWLHFYRNSKTVFILLGQVSVLHTLCFKPWFWMYLNLPFLPTNVNIFFLLFYTNENLSIQFSLTYFHIFTVLVMKTKCCTIWYWKTEPANSSERLINVYHTPKNMNLNCPLNVSSVCNKIKYLKLLDSEIRSDTYKQLAWKPLILFKCYLFMTHTHTHTHTC
jgi:hypothetical protein